MNPIAGTITTDFTEPRPVSNPGDHIHGAVDIAAPVNTPIFAPEDGSIIAWVAYRLLRGTYWPEMPVIDSGTMPWCNYFYDTFGGVLILAGDSGVVHVITHSYSNQLFNKGLFRDIRCYEEKANTRWPMHAVHTGKHSVLKGAKIGFVGNAGFSTGPHIHWEIHHGWKWDRWEDRINPEGWNNGAF